MVLTLTVVPRVNAWADGSAVPAGQPAAQRRADRADSAGQPAAQRRADRADSAGPDGTIAMKRPTAPPNVYRGAVYLRPSAQSADAPQASADAPQAVQNIP